MLFMSCVSLGKTFNFVEPFGFLSTEPPISIVLWFLSKQELLHTIGESVFEKMNSILAFSIRKLTFEPAK